VDSELPKEKKAESAKIVKKRTGLIGAIGALIDGIKGFFCALLGLDDGGSPGKVVMIPASGSPDINITKVEKELIRMCELIAKTDKNDPAFASMCKQCDDLLNDFKKQADKVRQAKEDYEKMHKDKPFWNMGKNKQKYEANIGMTTKKLNALRKSASKADQANKEILLYLTRYANTVKAIANHTKVGDPEQVKVWNSKEAEKALTKQSKSVSKHMKSALAADKKFEDETSS